MLKFNVSACFFIYEYKKQEIPMGFNLDLNKKINMQQQEILTTGTPVEVKSTPASVNVPIGKTETANTDLCSKLGITQEQYVKLCAENPNFATLDIEAQLKYISTKAADLSTSESVDETMPNNTETTANTEQQVPKMTKEQVIKTFSIDKAEYLKMPLKDKFNTYVTELAKNQFIYNTENPQSLEAWKNLSDEERNKLISQLKQSFIEENGGEKNLFGGNANAINVYLDDAMTELQTANWNQMSLEDLQSFSREEQSSMQYDYLRSLSIMAPEDQLSQSDKAYLEQEKRLSDALNYVLKQEDPSHEDVVFCPDDARNTLKQKNLTRSEVELAYLESKDPEKLSKKEKLLLKHLQYFKTSAGKEIIENAKANGSKNNQFMEAIKNSDYKEQYERAKTDKQKALVAYTFIKNSSKSDDEFKKNVRMYFKSSGFDNIYEKSAFTRYLFSEGPQKEQNAVAETEEAQGYAAMNADTMNEQTQKVYANTLNADIQKAKKTKDNNKLEKITENYKHALEIVNPDNGIVLGENAYNSGVDDIGLAANKLRNRMSDVENVKRMVNSSIKNASEAVNIDGVKSLHLMKAKEAILPSMEDYGNMANVNVTKALAEVPSKLDVEMQKEAGEITFKAAYLLDDKDAEEVHTILADNIVECDASVQADMHKMISQSKFDSVVEHAADNIYKYDESAQKDAMKYTLETGNEKAIETAISNVDRCEGLKNETSAAPSNSESYDSQLAKDIKTYTTKIEQKYINQVAQDYAAYTAEQDLRTGLIEEKETKSAVQAYIEKFKDPTTNKFALIGQLEPSQKKEAIKALVKYAPTLINAFIDMGYGPEILKIIGETSDIAIKVVNLMDYKGQSEVKEIVRKHPGHYEELYVKYFMDDKPSLAQNQYMTSPYGDNSMLKRMTREGQIYFNI